MSTADRLVEIQLLGLPVDVWARATEHMESVQREFDIIRGSVPVGTPLDRLKEFVDTLDVRLVDAGEPLTKELRAAAERGDTRADLSVEVPPEAAAAARALGVILDEVDDFCREGEALLTMATPAELVLFRQWMLSEYTDQIEEDAQPSSWEQFLARRGPLATVRPSAPRAGPRQGDLKYDGELDLSSAAELQAQIQEIRADGITHLTLDLTGVTFIDSVGLSLLVSAHNRIFEEGGTLQLVLPARLRPLFDLSGLVDLLSTEFRD